MCLPNMLAENNTNSILVKTSPSLALIKYWGKKNHGFNIPATTSIAVTLEGLTTTTLVHKEGSERLVIKDDTQTSEQSLSEYMTLVRKYKKISMHPDAHSINSFPTAAGLASSSSGFAALALGISGLEKMHLYNTESVSILLSNKKFSKEASMLARLGSVSASRSVYGGFTILWQGACYAEQLADTSYWSDLRIMVAIVDKGEKSVSSRNGMRVTAQTSPYYKAWLNDAKKISQEALLAFYAKDLEKLGTCMRASYLRMHASAMASAEPILYWLPESLTILKIAERLRKEGFSIWETMDAGPQVKLIYPIDEETALLKRFTALLEACDKQLADTVDLVLAKPGGKPEIALPDTAQFKEFVEKFHTNL